MSSLPSYPAGKNEDRGREYFVEGTVTRPKSFVLLLGFASFVVAVFQAGQWLLEVWNFLFHTGHVLKSFFSL